MQRLEPSLNSTASRRPETEVATLRWLDGRAAGRVHVLDRAIMVIGRDVSCRIRVEDEDVACRHAEIHSTAERPVLIEPDGRGATRLNGRLVDQAPLRDGDVVIVGARAVARFEYRGVIQRRPTSTLSPGDREIASRFVRGDALASIARSLGRPLEVVAARIRELHRRFGTTARVDLIAALSEVRSRDDDPPPR